MITLIQNINIRATCATWQKPSVFGVVKKTVSSPVMCYHKSYNPAIKHKCHVSMIKEMNHSINSFKENHSAYHARSFEFNEQKTKTRSTPIDYEYKCPVLFANYRESELERTRRGTGDCSQDGYHIFSLLSFLLSSFTTIINIVNNSNLNNNNNNNNNNDNNNNNNNVNVNMMKRRRRKRHGRVVTYNSVEGDHS